MVTIQTKLEFGYTLEIHLDSPTGTKLGELVLAAGTGSSTKQEKLFKIDLQPVSDGKFHTLYFTSKPNDSKEKSTAAIQWIQLQSK